MTLFRDLLDAKPRATLATVTLDPRTPVIVGVGQVLSRPHERLVEPLVLMVDALRVAADDAGSGGGRLLQSLDLLSSVASFVWHPADASLLVAERLGIHPKATQRTATGGTIPSKLMAQAAAEIAAGRIESAAFVGAEAMASRAFLKKQGERAQWTNQGSEVSPANTFGAEIIPLSELEVNRGLSAPVGIYPLFENARRRTQGETLEEHRRRLGTLWSSFSEVAVSNPFAWIPEFVDAEAIITPTPSNRMIAEPYTKRMVANLPVDQGAAVLMCSLGRARDLGVDPDLLVFPWAHVTGDDPALVSHRPALDRSVALQVMAPELLEAGGVELDEVAHFDLYSCFPVAVEMAADALGLGLDDPRGLTVTGGLTFAGGPGNNYVTHSLSSMVQRLRAMPGSIGLVSGLSYFATGHAMGLYSTRPPEHAFEDRDLQPVLAQFPLQAVADHLTGDVEVETYTVLHDREHGPISAIFAVRDRNQVRSWATFAEEGTLGEISGTDLLGTRGTMGLDGRFNFH